MLKTASLASRLSLKSIEQSLRVQQGRQFHASTAALARILCSDPIDQVCVDVLGAHGHDVVQKTFKDPKDLLKEIKEYDGLIVRSGTQVTKDVIEAGTNLKLIGRAGTGTDNIDVAAATRHGVIVMNTPGGNTMSAAELTMSLMMSLMRNIPQADASVKAGKWDRKSFMGRQLSGKTIGIVGLGRIGREVARWCQSFGMTTIGYDPILSESASKLSNITPVTLDELYTQSDIISLHVPLSADTKNLINKDSLAKCKDGVRIINCARGGVIDEEALLEGLNSGKVAGAALDVYRVEPPTDDTYDLIQHPKIIATPHLGASTKDAQVRVAHDIAKQFVNAMEGKEFVGVVNAPNIDFAKRSKLMPYLELAEKLGSMQAQLLGGEKLKKIYIIAEGKSISAPEMSEVLTTSVVKGVLSNLLEEEVNFVNALSLAEDMGLSVEEQRKATVEGANYSNQLTIAFETEKGTTRISGTIYGTDQLRLVQIDDFKTDIQPKGEMLLFRNDDRPGVLREVTSILAKAGINIESFELGRTGAGGQALGVITLDDPVPEDVLDEIRSLPFVHNPRTCHLMSLPANFGLDNFSDQKSTAASAYVSVNPKPAVRPANPEFSSGPCKKRPGYSLAKLNDWTLGRSHRSKLGKSQLKLAIEESKRILGLPKDYLLGIVPASDTGAFEMAMWSMLGAKPVDVCYWESFGKGWFGDISTQLKLENVTKLEADYGELPAFEKTNKDHDIIFTWNGTTSGVKVPNADWIHEDRTGLTFNDATSAAFAMPIDWPKVDVTTYSWQKVLGGEGAHGVLILSPKAVERLETYTPPRPLPKIFRMVKKGKVDRSIFEGSTINTPSMLCVEDYLDALRWADSIGGLDGLIGRSQANFRVLENFVQENDWIDFLAKDPATRSNTSVCLTLKLAPEKVKAMVALLEKEGVALDIGAYRDAPAGLRIWCGATVEKEDLEALMPWLSWAYQEVSAS